ncbi:MAG TPA: hypothetical protein VHQ66_16325 [Myxococcota bacterium]|jgi:hypothetical protein|nr:hypothetical protein [Myxococcota bacterium]
MNRLPLALGAGVALAATPAAAHPGHGVAAGSLLHYLASPEHALGAAFVALACAAAVALLARAERRARRASA